MERGNVFEIIDSEREHQEYNKVLADSHIVDDFPLSAGMEAIRFNLEKAMKAWYVNQKPYAEAMESIKKIAAICVQMGETYGMKPR